MPERLDPNTYEPGDQGTSERHPVKLLFGDTEINQGGLMRCCIASIHEYVMPRAESAAPDTLTISCLYESEKDTGNIILEKGVWRWNHD